MDRLIFIAKVVSCLSTVKIFFKEKDAAGHLWLRHSSCKETPTSMKCPPCQLCTRLANSSKCLDD